MRTTTLKLVPRESLLLVARKHYERASAGPALTIDRMGIPGPAASQSWAMPALLACDGGRVDSSQTRVSGRTGSTKASPSKPSPRG